MSPDRRISFLCIGILLLLCVGCSQESTSPQQTQPGIIDLQTYDFDSSGVLTLAYTFNFYWDTLLPPSTSPLPLPTAAVHLPRDWNDIPIGADGSVAGTDGKATYTANFIFSQEQVNRGPLVLKISNVRSAYEAYLDGKKIAQQGRLVPDIEEVDVVPQYIEFAPKDTLQLLFHVANTTTLKSGLVEALRLGVPRDIYEGRDHRWARDTFLISGLLMIGLYHLILTLFIPQRGVSFLFGLMCVLLVLRTGSTGEHLIIQWIPALPPWLTLRFEYGSMYLAPHIVGLFFKRTFPEEIPTNVLRLNGVITVILISSIFSPIDYWMGVLLPLCRFQLVVLGPFLIFWGIGRAIWRRRPGAWLFFVGLSALVAAAINDILYAQYFIDTGFLVSYGLLVLVICQATALSLRLTRAYQVVEDLSENLEVRVHENTQELALKNVELKDQKTLINEHHSELESSLKYAWKIQQAVLGEEDKLKQMFPNSFLFFRTRGIVSGDFYWFGQVENCKIVALGDVTGQGVPAAFLTIIVHTFFNHIVYEHSCTDPADIVNELDMHLKASFQQTDKQFKGTRLSILAIDEAKEKVNFAGASQSLFLAQPQGFDLIAGSEQIVGIASLDATTVSLPVELNGKNHLFLFTNGFEKQIGEANSTPFGEEAFLALLKENVGWPAERQEEVLNHTLEAWKKDQELTDDIAVIGIRL
ncbi:MAG TPA: hypothetical protein DCE41_33835 [Cytophagales bacterium]|nr:hypothetical protein [Cytophagales bacterium]HAA17976.1 hypothetical protein [Cytophagales bacterium]HAP64721.1 hypothetical protein [Cytophagales bacterium]